MATRAKNGSGPVSAIEVPVSALTEKHQVEMVANMQRQIEAQMFEIEMVRTANGHESSDVQPGGIATYGQAVHEKREQIRRLREGFSGLTPAVDDLLRGR